MNNKYFKNDFYKIIPSADSRFVECLVNYQVDGKTYNYFIFIEKHSDWKEKDYLKCAKKRFKERWNDGRVEAVKSNKSFKVPFIITLSCLLAFAATFGTLYGLGYLGKGGGGGGGGEPTKKYNAYFYDGDQEYVDLRELNLDYGSRVYRPTDDPFKEGYDFVGWYNDSSLTDKYDFSEKLIDDETEIKIYAKFDETMCHVTYVPDSGIVDGDNPVEVRYGYPIESAPTVRVEGAPVECAWYTTKTFDSGTEFTFGESGTSVEEKNFTLYGKTSGTAQYHDVVLDYNDGDTNEHTQSVPHNSTLTEPKINYPGHTLTNWTYVSGGEGNFDFTTQITTDNIKIQANWSEDVYNITYVTNGGTLTSKDTEAKYHDAVDAPVLADRPGYDKTVVQWYEKPDFTGTAFAFGVASDIESDITLYAKWGDIKTYDVCFYDDSTIPVEYTDLKETGIEYNDTAYRPTTDPSKDNCTFNGWYKEDRTTPFDFTQRLTGEETTIKVYAKFDPIVCRVTFNPNGGTITGDDYIDVNKGNSIPSNKKPTVTSPTDMGEPTWYTDVALTDEFKFDDPTTTDVDEGTKVTDSMTLYAGYEIKAGNSFENDSWTVFLNEINGKTFAQISGEDSPYHDEYDATTGFLGLTREVVITNEAGIETTYDVVVVDQNEEAQADENKFTFMLVTEAQINQVKFDSANNLYPNSDLCQYVDKLSYGLPNELKERLVLTEQLCHNPEPDQLPVVLKTRLFVPSMSQVFNDTTTVRDEGAQFDIFKNGDYSLMNGAWLRTPDKEAKTYAYYVNDSGEATLEDIREETSKHQVCAAFVIK